jgi:hypothetical protein
MPEATSEERGQTEDEIVASVAALLLGTVNAPEQEIWRVARIAVGMSNASLKAENERLRGRP